MKEIVFASTQNFSYLIPDEVAKMTEDGIVDYLDSNNVPIHDTIDSGIWGEALYMYDEDLNIVREFNVG